MPGAPEAFRARIRELCMAYPSTEERIQNPVHSGFLVKGKAFCYFLNDHHGDGRVSMAVKAMPGVQGALVDMDRTRFYLPPYMARHGWVGMFLDVEPIDWAQAAQLIEEAFLASAPKMVLKEYAARG